MHCDVTRMILILHIIQSEISLERSKIMNFYKRSYQFHISLVLWKYHVSLQLQGFQPKARIFNNALFELMK